MSAAQPRAPPSSVPTVPRAASGAPHLSPSLASAHPHHICSPGGLRAWHLLLQASGPNPSSAEEWLGCLCQKGSPQTPGGAPSAAFPPISPPSREPGYLQFLSRLAAGRGHVWAGAALDPEATITGQCLIQKMLYSGQLLPAGGGTQTTCPGAQASRKPPEVEEEALQVSTHASCCPRCSASLRDSTCTPGGENGP